MRPSLDSCTTGRAIERPRSSRGRDDGGHGRGRFAGRFPFRLRHRPTSARSKRQAGQGPGSPGPGSCSQRGRAWFWSGVSEVSERGFMPMPPRSIGDGRQVHWTARSELALWRLVPHRRLAPISRAPALPRGYAGKPT